MKFTLPMAALAGSLFLFGCANTTIVAPNNVKYITVDTPIMHRGNAVYALTVLNSNLDGCIIFEQKAYLGQCRAHEVKHCNDMLKVKYLTPENENLWNFHYGNQSTKYCGPVND